MIFEASLAFKLQAHKRRLPPQGARFGGRSPDRNQPRGRPLIRACLAPLTSKISRPSSGGSRDNAASPRPGSCPLGADRGFETALSSSRGSPHFRWALPRRGYAVACEYTAVRAFFGAHITGQ